MAQQPVSHQQIPVDRRPRVPVYRIPRRAPASNRQRTLHPQLEAFFQEKLEHERRLKSAHQKQVERLITAQDAQTRWPMIARNSLRSLLRKLASCSGSLRGSRRKAPNGRIARSCSRISFAK